jgi:ribose 5-phosphate isomerase B
MRIALGNDHAGYPLKEYVRSVIEGLGHEVVDRGAPSEDPVDFPDITWDTCDAVRKGEADRAVLVCGTGAGAIMAANKIAGINCLVGLAGVLATAETWGPRQRAEVDALISGKQPAHA